MIHGSRSLRRPFHMTVIALVMFAIIMLLATSSTHVDGARTPAAASLASSSEKQTQVNHPPQHPVRHYSRREFHLNNAELQILHKLQTMHLESAHTVMDIVSHYETWKQEANAHVKRGYERYDGQEYQRDKGDRKLEQADGVRDTINPRYLMNAKNAKDDDGHADSRDPPTNEANAFETQELMEDAGPGPDDAWWDPVANRSAPMVISWDYDLQPNTDPIWLQLEKPELEDFSTNYNVPLFIRRPTTDGSHLRDDIEEWPRSSESYDLAKIESSARLESYCVKLTNMSIEEDWWNRIMPGVMEQTLYKDDVLLYPSVQNYWGFWFYKDAWITLGLTVPQTMDEMMTVCQKVNSYDGTYLIGFAIEGQPWMVQMIIDYLVLRTCGIDQWNRFMDGVDAYTMYDDGSSSDYTCFGEAMRVFDLMKQNHCFRTDNDTSNLAALDLVIGWDFTGEFKTVLYSGAIQAYATDASLIDFFRFPDITYNETISGRGKDVVPGCGWAGSCLVSQRTEFNTPVFFTVNAAGKQRRMAMELLLTKYQTEAYGLRTQYAVLLLQGRLPVMYSVASKMIALDPTGLVTRGMQQLFNVSKVAMTPDVLQWPATFRTYPLQADFSQNKLTIEEYISEVETIRVETILGSCVVPTFSPTGGTFNGQQVLTLSTPTNGSILYSVTYLDMTSGLPLLTTTSSLYVGPIVLFPNTRAIVNAHTAAPLLIDSDTISDSYVILDANLLVVGDTVPINYQSGLLFVATWIFVAGTGWIWILLVDMVQMEPEESWSSATAQSAAIALLWKRTVDSKSGTYNHGSNNNKNNVIHQSAPAAVPATGAEEPQSYSGYAYTVDREEKQARERVILSTNDNESKSNHNNSNHNNNGESARQATSPVPGGLHTASIQYNEEVFTIQNRARTIGMSNTRNHRTFECMPRGMLWVGVVMAVMTWSCFVAITSILQTQTKSIVTGSLVLKWSGIMAGLGVQLICTVVFALMLSCWSIGTGRLNSIVSASTSSRSGRDDSQPDNDKKQNVAERQHRSHQQQSAAVIIPIKVGKCRHYASRCRRFLFAYGCMFCRSSYYMNAEKEEYMGISSGFDNASGGGGHRNQSGSGDSGAADNGNGGGSSGGGGTREDGSGAGKMEIDETVGSSADGADSGGETSDFLFRKPSSVQQPPKSPNGPAAGNMGASSPSSMRYLNKDHASKDFTMTPASQTNSMAQGTGSVLGNDATRQADAGAVIVSEVDGASSSATHIAPLMPFSSSDAHVSGSYPHHHATMDGKHGDASTVVAAQTMSTATTTLTSTASSNISPHLSGMADASRMPPDTTAIGATVLPPASDTRADASSSLVRSVTVNHVSAWVPTNPINEDATLSAASRTNAGSARSATSTVVPPTQASVAFSSHASASTRTASPQPAVARGMSSHVPHSSAMNTVEMTSPKPVSSSGPTITIHIGPSSSPSAPTTIKPVPVASKNPNNNTNMPQIAIADASKLSSRDHVIKSPYPYVNLCCNTDPVVASSIGLVAMGSLQAWLPSFLCIQALTSNTTYLQMSIGATNTLLAAVVSFLLLWLIVELYRRIRHDAQLRALLCLPAAIALWIPHVTMIRALRVVYAGPISASTAVQQHDNESWINSSANMLSLTEAYTIATGIVLVTCFGTFVRTVNVNISVRHKAEIKDHKNQQQIQRVVGYVNEMSGYYHQLDKKCYNMERFIAQQFRNNMIQTLLTCHPHSTFPMKHPLLRLFNEAAIAAVPQHGHSNNANGNAPLTSGSSLSIDKAPILQQCMTHPFASSYMFQEARNGLRTDNVSFIVEYKLMQAFEAWANSLFTPSRPAAAAPTRYRSSTTLPSSTSRMFMEPEESALVSMMNSLSVFSTHQYEGGSQSTTTKSRSKEKEQKSSAMSGLLHHLDWFPSAHIFKSHDGGRGRNPTATDASTAGASHPMDVWLTAPYLMNVESDRYRFYRDWAITMYRQFFANKAPCEINVEAPIRAKLIQMFEGQDAVRSKESKSVKLQPSVMGSSESYTFPYLPTPSYYGVYTAAFEAAFNVCIGLMVSNELGSGIPHEKRRFIMSLLSLNPIV